MDLVRLRTAGYLPEEGQELRFADYYRAIKRPIIQQALGVNAAADLRLILVSSALPGEGKTFTSVNLALSMAREHDISVLLVDADLSRSHLSRTLGVENEPGLVDSLLDETQDVESFIMRSYTRGLDFLPAGRPTAGTTELIASARMAQLASWLSTGNPRRLVLFDSAPLLVSSILETIRGLAANGTSFLLVEQNAKLALRHSDRAYVLRNGKVSVAGRSSEILSDSALLNAYLG